MSSTLGGRAPSGGSGGIGGAVMSGLGGAAGTWGVNLGGSAGAPHVHNGTCQKGWGSMSAPPGGFVGRSRAAWAVVGQKFFTESVERRRGFHET